MPAAKLLPGVDEIKRLLRNGETRASIARTYGVNRTAVSLALTRAGEEPGQVRHDQMLPWRVRAEHASQYPARMLRLEGRIRNGLEVNAGDDARLASWKRSLHDNDDSVIMYFAEHDCPSCEGAGGFHVVRRKDARRTYGKPHPGFDTELIFVTREQDVEAVKRLA